MASTRLKVERFRFESFLKAGASNSAIPSCLQQEGLWGGEGLCGQTICGLADESSESKQGPVAARKQSEKHPKCSASQQPSAASD